MKNHCSNSDIHFHPQMRIKLQVSSGLSFNNFSTFFRHLAHLLLLGDRSFGEANLKLIPSFWNNSSNFLLTIDNAPRTTGIIKYLSTVKIFLFHFFDRYKSQSYPVLIGFILHQKGEQYPLKGMYA